MSYIKLGIKAIVLHHNFFFFDNLCEISVYAIGVTPKLMIQINELKIYGCFTFKYTVL